MIRNRTAQIIVESMYVALGIVGFFGSLGLYDAQYDPDWFTYFTNLSNYLCIGVMFAELVQNCRKKGDSAITTAPRLKFISVTAILLTCFVFNFLLAGQPDRTLQDNLTVTCILFHTMLPILFVLDWFLFYPPRSVRWTAPLLSTIFPLAYCAFIFVRAGFWPYANNPYPYFFLNPEQVGINGVLMWIGILFVTFLVLSYLLMWCNHALPTAKKGNSQEKASGEMQ